MASISIISETFGNSKKLPFKNFKSYYTTANECNLINGIENGSGIHQLKKPIFCGRKTSYKKVKIKISSNSGVKNS